MVLPRVLEDSIQKWYPSKLICLFVFFDESLDFRVRKIGKGKLYLKTKTSLGFVQTLCKWSPEARRKDI